MSTVADPKLRPSSLPGEDPYYYGFRDEHVLQPDGTYKRERIPLTLEDHLHPHEGDQFMEGSLHDLLRSYLRDVFRMRLQSDPTALVLSDAAVYWDDPALGHHAPDVAVIPGVTHQRVEWKAFHVAKEQTRPSLIIELVTARFRKTEVVEKFSDYHKARVPTYVILDREHDDDPWSIKAYHRNPQRFVPQPLEEGGKFWLEDLNLWLGVDGHNIRCFDGDSGEEMGDYSSVTRRMQQMRDLANAEKARAEAEKARAEAEKARAETAEARLREVEAELARLKGLPPVQ
jgi:colicin import membrane protein